jgi:hypothetical protein
MFRGDLTPSASRLGILESISKPKLTEKEVALIVV